MPNQWNHSGEKIHGGLKNLNFFFKKIDSTIFDFLIKTPKKYNKKY